MAVLSAVAVASNLLAASSRNAGLGKPPPIRYLVNSGDAQSVAASAGWNLLDVDSKAEADSLPAGTRGLLWLGGYDNSTCAWERSDATLTRVLAGTARDRKVAGYLFSDEPDPRACPGAPAQHRARSRFLHSLAPGKLTVMVADANSSAQSLAQIPLWVGAADRVALDPYPCYRNGRRGASHAFALCLVSSVGADDFRVEVGRQRTQQPP